MKAPTWYLAVAVAAVLASLMTEPALAGTQGRATEVAYSRHRDSRHDDRYRVSYDQRLHCRGCGRLEWANRDGYCERCYTGREIGRQWYDQQGRCDRCRQYTWINVYGRCERCVTSGRGRLGYDRCYGCGDRARLNAYGYCQRCLDRAGRDRYDDNGFRYRERCRECGQTRMCNSNHYCEQCNRATWARRAGDRRQGHPGRRR